MFIDKHNISSQLKQGTRGWLLYAITALAVFSVGARCTQPRLGDSKSQGTSQTSQPPKRPPVDNRPPPLHRPISLWQNGRVSKQVDASTAAEQGLLVLDLGEQWTPYIFSERETEADLPVPNPYRPTYLTLAEGKFPKDFHGERAREDKYLELYGIMPTLGLLRARFEQAQSWAAKADCQATEALADAETLKAFQGFITYRGNDVAKRMSDGFRILEKKVGTWVASQQVPDAQSLNTEKFSDRDIARLKEYLKLKSEVDVVRATQRRMLCEGFYVGKGKYVDGFVDWATHEAVAEFERRHRIYGWGYIGKETLDALRKPAVELEREALVRVLTERAMHALGVLEDGSVTKNFRGADGQTHTVPNLEAALQIEVVTAFGLDTADKAYTWLKGLGSLQSVAMVAIKAPPLPEYYSADMNLHVVIDPGEVWYDFPFDEVGKELPQPISRRPKLTVFVRYLNQEIPLARYGTTIGGWRSELVGGNIVWKYKGSPDGIRVWKYIHAAPVWVPPETTPHAALLERDPNWLKRRKTGLKYRVKYHEMGPSYASAYGLVAAYHQTYAGGEEGIRTHGSVDYMSIMRRHSHGCHRLHNHIAVRLMSFVLEHRAHKRLGQDRVSVERILEQDGEKHTMKLKYGGYMFELLKPVEVNVLKPKVQGKQKTPIYEAIPKYVPPVPDAGVVPAVPPGVEVPPAVIAPPATPPVPAVPPTSPPPAM